LEHASRAGEWRHVLSALADAPSAAPVITGAPSTSADSELPLQGSNLDFPGSEPGVLPITPRGNEEASAGDSNPTAAREYRADPPRVTPPGRSMREACHGRPFHLVRQFRELL